MSFRVTVRCTRAQGEAIGAMDDIAGFGDSPPVLVADEPDESKPDDWLIHAYFDHHPTLDDIALMATLGSGAPVLEQLGDANWVALSQAGLQPIRAGRFTVHTPTFKPDPGRINFEIDAGLAFGTGQHATTAGCLAALDTLASNGSTFANIADIGTGTGLLAFAALALWPAAKCIATDVDPVAIDVSQENAAINGIRLGHGAGELLLAVADGTDSPMLAARAPFDLIVANILAGPLIALASDLTATLARNGTIILAGLLASQAADVLAAYASEGMELAARIDSGDWSILTLVQAS